MAKTDIPAPERLLELSPGMAIWRVHLDSLRERDVNARVMSDDKFKRLAENIKAEGQIESLPLVTKIADREEFLIISGHHRTRASRSAGILVIPVIVIERELSEDEITAKQLSHNALAGYDDPEKLQELYDSINDINAKLASGVTDLDLRPDLPNIPTDDIDVNFDFEPIYILFMKSGAEKFEALLDSLQSDAKIYAADKKDFAKFVDTVSEISKHEDIRNIAGIMTLMMEIVEQHYAEKPKD